MGSNSKRKKRKKRLKAQKGGKRPTLSVCMIVKNEEKHLGRCLESIKDIADEIVIIDTGSTDRSIEIARSYGAKLYMEPWSNDFSKHRNQSINHAAGDWILILDADEVIPRKELNKLKAAIRRPWADAYRMTTRNYQRNQGQVNTFETRPDYPEEQGYQYWVPSTKIRLFRRVGGIHFKGAVHELVETSIEELGLKIGDLNVPVLHFGDVDKNRDNSRYLKAAIKKVEQFPNSPQAHFELALILSNMGKHQQALKTITNAIELMDNGVKDQYIDPKKLFTLKGISLTALGQYSAAIEMYQKAIQLSPTFIEAINNMGICYEALGDFDAAERCLKQALAMKKDANLLQKNLNRIRAKQESKRTLSICMIVKNENKNIEKAIRSVKAFADEIIVVDTGSTDNTPEIAMRLGAKVSFFQWCDDFSAARNASLDLATGDWILWLDGDDYIPPTQWRKLQDLKLFDNNQAFMFKVSNEGPEKRIFWQLRMFPRDSRVRFLGAAHEQITPSLMALNIPIKKADILIMHLGYSDPVTIKLKKDRNLRILKKQIDKNPNDIMAHFNLGYEYFSRGNYKEAIHHLERVAEDSDFKRDFRGGCSIAMVYLGKAYIACGNLSKAISILETAIDSEVSHLALLSLASCYNALNEPTKALDILKSIDRSNLISTLPIDITDFEYSLELETARALEGIGELQEAINACRRAEKLCLQRPEARDIYLKILEKSNGDINLLHRVSKSSLAAAEDFYQLGNVLVKNGRISEAEAAFRHALEKDPIHLPSIKSLYALLRHKGHHEEATSVILETLKLDICGQGHRVELLDTLFVSGEWESILQTHADKETLPTRLAARLISGIDQGMEYEILSLFKELGADIRELEINGLRAIWNLALKLNGPQKFHLAVSCFHLDPSLKEAGKVAVEGYLARGKVNKAMELADRYIKHSPEGIRELAQVIPVGCKGIHGMGSEISASKEEEGIREEKRF